MLEEVYILTFISIIYIGLFKDIINTYNSSRNEILFGFLCNRAMNYTVVKTELMKLIQCNNDISRFKFLECIDDGLSYSAECIYIYIYINKIGKRISEKDAEFIKNNIGKLKKFKYVNFNCTIIINILFYYP